MATSVSRLLCLNLPLLLLLCTAPDFLDAQSNTTAPSPTAATNATAPSNSTAPSPAPTPGTNATASSNSTAPPTSASLTPAANSSACSKTGTVAGVAYSHTWCVAFANGRTLAWSVQNNSIVAVFSSQPAEAYGWVGFGWAPDCKMVGSSVVIGWGNSEETDRNGVEAFYLESNSYQTYPTYQNNAYKPKLDTFVLTQDPAVEVLDDGMRIVTSFAVQVVGGGSATFIKSNGTQCVIMAGGPKLTNGDWDAQPYAKLKNHPKENALLAQMDFGNGTLVSPSPSSSKASAAVASPTKWLSMVLAVAVSLASLQLASCV